MQIPGGMVRVKTERDVTSQKHISGSGALFHGSTPALYNYPLVGRRDMLCPRKLMCPPYSGLKLMRSSVLVVTL